MPMAEYGGDWRGLSACLDEDPDLFFPDGTTGAALNQMELARRVCLRCPVRLECLQMALATGIGDGVWGAMTPEERRSFRRRHYRTDLRRVNLDGLASMLRKQEESVRDVSYEQRIAAETALELVPDRGGL